MKFSSFVDHAFFVSETASHLPARLVTTEELFPENAAELLRLTGIRTRHYAAETEATSALATAAIQKLGSYQDAERLLIATVSPDYPSPATAPLVQHTLGLPMIPSLDLSAACAGYVYALDLAARCVLSGDNAVLFAAAETRSRAVQDSPNGVRCLFGDGAAAGMLRRGGTGLRLHATMLGADGRGHAEVRIEAGGSRHPVTPETFLEKRHALRMLDGPSVFFQAVEGFVHLAESFCKAAGLSLHDIDWIVPHQANLRLLERVFRLLRFPLSKVVLTVEHTGNTGGASAGIALDQALRDGCIQPGQRILLLTAGAGYTLGAALLEYSP